ncbi:hypothetical protein SAMN04487897_11741 [Paenibacillus sp. yr247]|uniref:hypothetical protein n=1 Tax=Paenibacillus sp. yr247 TaxID=1761880 RepID=UPI00088CFD59|nr:hypothetical protein [Paenibacillus sp. yr247]SDO58125.1 hypothetical protein SAMN04487897_11741 [Paenibacillus sp. yr247]
MPNITLQDVIIFVNGTSRYNNNSFDTALVKTTIKTDEPILDEYYVPSGVTASPALLNFLRLQNLEVTPFKASTLLAGTEDIQQEALNGNPAGTLEDAAKLLLLSVLKKSTLTPVTGSTNLYELTYEYKIFPLTNQGLPNTYELQIRVPFDGLGMVNGSRVEVTAVLPRFAEIDAAVTNGRDTNSQEITELIYELPNVNRKTVTFAYQLDPLFTIRYNHTQGIEG